MKRALIVTTVSGFLPQFELYNAKLLQTIGYEVHYAANFNNPVYSDDNSRLDGTNITCHHIDFCRSPYNPSNLIAFRELKGLMNEFNFDLVHCHTPVGGILARLMAKKYRKTGTKVIYTAHGFHFFKHGPLLNWLIYYPIECYFARYTDAILTINYEDYKRAKKICNRLDTKVYYVEGVGVNIDKIQEEIDDIPAGHLKNQLGVSEQTQMLISVGELTKRKNQQIILKAIANLKITNTDIYENIHYVICGRGKMEEKLKKMVHRYLLSEKVSFLGYREDACRLVAESDIFLLPSLQEGLSLALMEAMTIGKLIACSKIRGNIDLIKVPQGGCLVEANNVDGWKDAIIKMYQLPQQERKDMISFNQQRIKKYSSKVVLEKMRKIYKEVAK